MLYPFNIFPTQYQKDIIELFFLAFCPAVQKTTRFPIVFFSIILGFKIYADYGKFLLSRVSQPTLAVHQFQYCGIAGHIPCAPKHQDSPAEIASHICSELFQPAYTVAIKVPVKVDIQAVVFYQFVYYVLQDWLPVVAFVTDKHIRLTGFLIADAFFDMLNTRVMSPFFFLLCCQSHFYHLNR